MLKWVLLLLHFLVSIWCSILISWAIFLSFFFFRFLSWLSFRSFSYRLLFTILSVRLTLWKQNDPISAEILFAGVCKQPITLASWNFVSLRRSDLTTQFFFFLNLFSDKVETTPELLGWEDVEIFMCLQGQKYDRIFTCSVPLSPDCHILFQHYFLFCFLRIPVGCNVPLVFARYLANYLIRS